MKCHRCNFVITEDRPSIWVDALTGGSICGRVNGAIVFHSPEPVTGQPAPPTPAQPTCWVKCPKCGQGVAIWTASGVCKCGAFVCYDGTELAAAQPLTPPQPPLEVSSLSQQKRVHVQRGGRLADFEPKPIEAAPPSLTAPLTKFGNEVSAGGESAGGNTETLTSVSAPEQRNPSGKPQPSARPSDAHSQFTSLTAEELAPLYKLVERLSHDDDCDSDGPYSPNPEACLRCGLNVEIARLAGSLPGIKVVRG